MHREDANRESFNMSVRSPFGSSHFVAISSNSYVRDLLGSYAEELKAEYPALLYAGESRLYVEECRSFEEICLYLETIDNRVLMNLICLIDLTDGFRKGKYDWRIDREGDKPLFNAQELVLNFPEVYFIFVMPKRREGGLPKEHVLWSNDLIVSSNNTFLKGLNAFCKSHICGFRNWFDGTGFRRFILKSSSVIDKTDSERKLAFSIDEEATYNLLNGYFAYIHGYDCHLVNTKAQFDNCFSYNSQKFESISKVLILEDQDVLFSDLTGSCKKDFDFLTERFIDCNAFSGNCLSTDNENKDGEIHRILITTNPSTLDDIKEEEVKKIEEDSNKKNITTTQNGSIAWKTWPKVKIQKPHGGVYCNKLLKQVPRDKECSSDIPQRLDISKKTEAKKGGNHSAPFVNQLIAENLRSRATKIYSLNASFEDAIQVALLAADGLVLLQGQTHTLVKECIALLFRAEVLAESQFPGVNYSQATEKRLVALQDIYNKHLLPNFEEKPSSVPKDERWQRSVFMLEVYNDLRKIYLAHGRFEEEEQTLIKIRKVYRTTKITEASTVNKADSSVNKNGTTSNFRKLFGTIRDRMEGPLLKMKEVINGCWRKVKYFPLWYLYHLVNKGVKAILIAVVAWCLFFSFGLLALYFCYWELYKPEIWVNVQMISVSYEILEKVMRAFFNLEISPLHELIDCMFDGGNGRTFISDAPVDKFSIGLARIVKMLSFLVSITGLAHTGIFIAYIYQKISRK